MKKRIYLLALLVMALISEPSTLQASPSAKYAETTVNNTTQEKSSKKDTKKTSVKTDQKEKKSFWNRLATPIRWFGRNWSAYDPKYSTPSFYNWVGQLQNDFSKEWLNMKYNDGMEVKMHSRLSSKLGPYLGWRFLGYGYSIDLAAIHGSSGKSEMGLDINSNLMNIQLIYRHTGGDFQISKLTTRAIGESQQLEQKDVTELAQQYNIGDRIKYSVIGANFNFFLNHKKYSNPAAFSNGAIQLKSVGSPIVGFGIQRQKVTTTVSDLMEGYVLQGVASQMSNTSMGKLIYEFNQKNGTNFPLDATGAKSIFDYIEEQNVSEADDSPEKYRTAISSLIHNEDAANILFGNSMYVNMLINQVPSTMTIDDIHLQLGYAYNIAFSKRLLLGLSIIASPGIKHVRMDNEYNMTNYCADEFVDAANSFYAKKLGIDVSELPADKKATRETFCMDVNRTQFGYDFFARASLTYNFDRWRVGVNANANAYIYKSNDASMRNTYGNVKLYVGYCFGRKKQYRWNGKDRQAYIMAALKKKDILAMKDTMPAGNIANSKVTLEKQEKEKKTSYSNDYVNLSIDGCDLVKGPDGSYGSYTIEDGYVAPGQDNEGHLKPGTVLPVDESGSLKISSGHDKDIRAANWWKSQLNVRQIPTNWYPEMLHYALKGKLTLWIRSYKLGTTQPVQLVIDDFCISHGKETKKFTQIASKQFASHSAYSIIGKVNVNNRVVRIYIESKKNGKKNYLYVCPMKLSTLKWMENVPDERPISRLSIPATHDAGTASLPEGKLTSMAHTQNLTIAEQLEDGIRAFDIRLKHNMKFGHTMECRDGLPETLDSIQKFLKHNPSEFIVAMIGSDEGGKWSDEMKQNYSDLIKKYSDIMVDSFSPRTPLGEVRGKVLVIKRQEDCPFGKLLKFQDNTTFEYNGFCVEDVYKEHKTYKKIKIVEKHIREAHECLDPDKWYITFNSIAWDPRHHKPYYSAWGAVNVRKPMNPSLRTVIEDKAYTNFGMVFLDFYNDHCDHPQLVESIIKSNFNTEVEKDFIPAGKGE